MRFIQGYAVDRALELAEYTAPANQVHHDPFVNERRFEQRFPGLVPEISTWMQGYEKNFQSARSILNFLEAHFEVNGALAKAIRELCA